MAIRMDNIGRLGWSVGNRRKITQPLTIMLKPIICPYDLGERFSILS